MTARCGRLFPKFALAFQVFRELLPLCGPTDAVGLHSLIVDELRGIAVLEIVAVVDDLPIFDASLTEFGLCLLPLCFRHVIHFVLALQAYFVRAVITAACCHGHCEAGCGNRHRPDAVSDFPVHNPMVLKMCLYSYSPEIAKRLHGLPCKSDAEGQREVEWMLRA